MLTRLSMRVLRGTMRKTRQAGGPRHWMNAGVLAAALLPAAGAMAQLAPIHVSADGRYLQRASGKPFFWTGDTAWSLYKLDPAELDQYFSDRRTKGFNVIQGPLLLYDLPNYAGHTNPNPAAPNANWFAHIDTIIASAAAHGLYITPVLAWGNQANLFTTQIAYDYGYYVGNRYRDATNVAAFIVAGEFNHPAPNVAIWDAMASGLQAGLAGAPRLITALPRWYGVWGGQSSSHDLHGKAWLTFNMIQSSQYGDCTNNASHLYYLGTHNWKLVEQDWARLPVKPVLDAEPSYEDAPIGTGGCDFNPPRWDDFGVRRRAYWSVFAGGFGHTYGANGVFQFFMPDNTDGSWSTQAWWYEAIHFPGAAQMGHLRKLMQSRPLENRRNGQGMLTSSPGDNVPQHIHAARDAQGRWAMVYVPGATVSISINMEPMSGNVHKAWWFNPATGGASFIAQYTSYGAGGILSITTPSTGEDWVLVLDDAAQAYPAPGAVPFELLGDINRDGAVDVVDLLAVVDQWGSCPAPPSGPCLADLNGDGSVNVNDLVMLLEGWTQ